MSNTLQSWKTTLGLRLERISHDVFDAFRWMVSVSMARYVAITTESQLFWWISYALTAVLFAFLMAVFLLRGEVKLFHRDGKAAMIGNLIINMMICLGTFIASLWVVYSAVDVFSAYFQSK